MQLVIKPPTLELKNSKYADAVANIYRASTAMAQGSESVAITFLQKSIPYFDSTIVEKINLVMKPPTKQYPYDIKLVWAEKILDLYTMLKYSK